MNLHFKLIVIISAGNGSLGKYMNSDNVEEGADWVEEIQRELQKIRDESDISVAEMTDAIALAVKERQKVEDDIRRENDELKRKLNDQKFQLDEMEMERDVLLQQVHGYLEINSSLKIRLEEQRCQNGALKSQATADLEKRIRALEGDKERLMAANMEKEKEIRKMRFLLQEGNEESEVTAMRRQLKRASEDKVKAEGKLREVLLEQRKAEEKPRKGRKSEPALRRSASEGDVGSQRLESPERNIVLEGAREFVTNSKLRERGLRAEEVFVSTESKNKKFPEPPVHAVLDAVRLGLFNVARKLEYLKTQLIYSGAIEKVKESQRNLKRKAETLETEENTASEPKAGFKDLKNLLEDAKFLNAKLDSLRDEKQKLMEGAKREKEVQVAAERSEASSQTTERERHFERAVAGLKRAMCECESELEEGSLTKEDAFAAFTSALITFTLNNLRFFNPSRSNVAGGADSFEEEGLSESKETGGGDNSLKFHEKPRNDFKIEMSRLKYEIGLFRSSGDC